MVFFGAVECSASAGSSVVLVSSRSTELGELGYWVAVVVDLYPHLQVKLSPPDGMDIEQQPPQLALEADVGSPAWLEKVQPPH